jgi:hypothetical protein
MAKRVTVFYSWQSDTPSSLNRSFIERALTEAVERLESDATLDPALRDGPIELDKDTLGVAGSPPITETIFRKIEECAVFVADLTFVGTSSDQVRTSTTARLLPNPNVLLEYGYALRCHSDSALVGVMNEAFGTAESQNLPFDLRHRRWPIRYNLSSDSSASQKAAQFEKLANAFVGALRLILTQRAALTTTAAGFTPQHPGQDASVFFDNTDDLVPDVRSGQKPGSYTVPNEGRAYLRLYPTGTVPPFETELDAENVARDGNLWPMGRVNGRRTVRNVYGAIAYDPPDETKLCHFVQLFLSREIWAVDALCVNAARCREFNQEFGQNVERVYIASGYIMKVFVDALHNYIHFAKEFLRLPLPVRIKAGLLGVKDYRIATDNTIRGSVLQNSIEWETDLRSYDTPVQDVLASFFARVWKKSGVQWTTADQQNLTTCAKAVHRHVT